MRCVVITGAASGIGLALARRYADRGDALVLADIDEQSLSSAVSELSAATEVLGVPTDVRDETAVTNLVNAAIDRHGRVDVMFNNAGIGIGGDAQELTPQHWRHVVDTNLMGVVHGVHAVYPHMVAQRSGRIVNTASLAGLIGVPMLAPYSSVKHAVVGLSLSLRAEAARFGVTVSCVCPGFTDTAILDAMGPADLPTTSMAGRGREFAARAPGGIYRVESLARDIERGVDRGSAMIVAPASARWIWRLNRLAPGLVGWAAKRGVARESGGLG